MRQWAIDRLKERSTWTGLVSALVGAGVMITPEQAEAVIAAGLGIGGLIWSLTADGR